MEQELKFSDFLGSKHQYDHTKEDVWEAMGATEQDVEALRTKFMAVFHSEAKGALSEKIEKSLDLDMPAPWKAFGFIKIGSAITKSKLMEFISEAPDSIPMPVFKGILLMMLTKGGDV